MLVAALLVAFPEGRFGFGLPGGKNSLGLDDNYRSLGKDPVDLSDKEGGRDLLEDLFNYLIKNSYWTNDDNVHILALLTDLCEDRDRVKTAKILSLSTSGNHLVDPGLFYAYQLIEALLEKEDRESMSEVVTRAKLSHVEY